jgi:hypothetical protein
MSKGSISKKENPTPEKGIRKKRKKKISDSLEYQHGGCANFGILSD